MDARYWQELEALDPVSVCRRSGAVAERGGYRIRVFDQDCMVMPRERRLLRSRVGGEAQAAQAVSDELELLVAQYLIHAKDIPLANEWVGLQELGSANRFFASHVPDFGLLLPLLSSAPEAVVRAAQSLGGGRLDYGDLSVSCRVLPRLPIAFVYWAAGDEFAEAASVLFDRTAEQHMPLDVLSATVQEAIATLARLAR